MNINSAFPSTYLKADDLQGKRVAVTMDRVQMEDVGGDHKPVLYFVGKDRGLVLNKTNASIIAEMYGAETDNWLGKKITLYPARVEFQGRIVTAIRVHLDPSVSEEVQAPLASQPRPATPRSAPVEQKPSAVFDKVIDDEIPF